MQGDLLHTYLFLTIIHICMHFYTASLNIIKNPTTPLNRQLEQNPDCLDQSHETVHGANVTGCFTAGRPAASSRSSNKVRKYTYRTRASRVGSDGIPDMGQPERRAAPPWLTGRGGLCRQNCACFRDEMIEKIEKQIKASTMLMPLISDQSRKAHIKASAM